MKKGIYVLIFIVFFIIICFASYGNKFTKEKDIIYAYGEIIEKQTQMDKKIRPSIVDNGRRPQVIYFFMMLLLCICVLMLLTVQHL